MKSTGVKMRSKDSSGTDFRVQFSLRLPGDLHARLVERAGLVPLNSFIIQSLEQSLSTQDLIRLADEVVKESVENRDRMAAQMREMSRVIHDMSRSMIESINLSRALSEQLAQMNEGKSSTEVILPSLEESQKQLPQDASVSTTQSVSTAKTRTAPSKKGT